MDKNSLKRAMMELWEKTFHDSTEYISLIFDNYFDEKYVAYREEEGKLVASLLGIPYHFGAVNNKLSGLYLCGIATDVAYRRKGLMKSLLEEINTRVRDEFDFTFLIPSSDLIANYYRNQGYFNSFYRMEKRYTSVHDFKNDFLVSLSDNDDRIKVLKQNLFNNLKVERFSEKSTLTETQIIDFISECELKLYGSASIKHTYKDLVLAIKENKVSDDFIFYSFDRDKNITGVAFVKKKEIKRIVIPVMFITDQPTYYVLLNNIKEYFSDYSISVYSTKTLLSNGGALIDEFYNVANPNGGMLESLVGYGDQPFNPYKLMEPYGMARLLNFKNIIHYLAKNNHETEFNFILKDSQYNKDQLKELLKVKNGKVSSCLISCKGKKENNFLELSIKEFSEILLRKKDSNNLIMEAFGIPRLELEMSLMLD